MKKLKFFAGLIALWAIPVLPLWAAGAGEGQESRDEGKGHGNENGNGNVSDHKNNEDRGNPASPEAPERPEDHFEQPNPPESPREQGPKEAGPPPHSSHANPASAEPTAPVDTLVSNPPINTNFIDTQIVNAVPGSLAAASAPASALLIVPSPSGVSSQPGRVQGISSREKGALVFRPAEEVAQEQRTWGLESKSEAVSSSVQMVVTGTVIGMDKNKHQVLIKDKRDHVKTLYLNPANLVTLRKGAVVQATVEPGSNRAENVHQLVA